jgi:hypothetical protein
MVQELEYVTPDNILGNYKLTYSLCYNLDQFCLNPAKHALVH